MPVAPGDVVAGKFAVVRLVGRGGMGTVFEARHKALGQRVAIKFLDAGAAESQEAVERFLREARAAANLTSEHVVRVFDVGTHDSGLPFMVMELLDGVDLGTLLERRGAVPVPDAVRWVLQAAEAVAEAHEAGIVHRDLKPSNLFLARPSSAKRAAKIKVLDFGISKHGGLEPGSVLTLTGPKSVMGSPSYMSPEQVRSTKNVDARTDVWSLGVILYELLTGRLAFDGESLGDVFAKIREEPLASVRTIRPSVPASLEQILARCLERDRDRRFPDAAALADALRATSIDGIEDEPSGSYAGRPSGSMATTAFDPIPSSTAAPSSALPESGTVAPWISARRRSPQRRLVALVFALGTGALALTAAAVAVLQTSPPAPATAVAAPAEPRGPAPRPAAPESPTTIDGAPPASQPPAVVPEPSADPKAPPRARPPATSRPRSAPPPASGSPAVPSPPPGPRAPARPTVDPNDLGI